MNRSRFHNIAGLGSQSTDSIFLMFGTVQTAKLLVSSRRYGFVHRTSTEEIWLKQGCGMHWLNSPSA